MPGSARYGPAGRAGSVDSPRAATAPSTSRPIIPGEFGLVESWSGTSRPRSPSIFGGRKSLLTLQLAARHAPRSAALALRRAHTFFWLYTGTDDRFRAQNAAFVTELSAAGLAHRFRIVRRRARLGALARERRRLLSCCLRHFPCGVRSRFLRSWWRCSALARPVVVPGPRPGLPGPRVAEALPLDELAKRSSAPLLWFVGRLARGRRGARTGRPLGACPAPGRGVLIALAVWLCRLPRRPALRSLSHGRSRPGSPSTSAERLGAVYLPAALVGLAVALIAGRVRGHELARDRRERRRGGRGLRAAARDASGRERGAAARPDARRGRPSLARSLRLCRARASLRLARSRPPPPARWQPRGRRVGALDGDARAPRHQPRHARVGARAHPAGRAPQDFVAPGRRQTRLLIATRPAFASGVAPSAARRSG